MIIQIVDILDYSVRFHSKSWYLLYEHLRFSVVVLKVCIYLRINATIGRSKYERIIIHQVPWKLNDSKKWRFSEAEPDRDTRGSIVSPDSRRLADDSETLTKIMRLLYAQCDVRGSTLPVDPLTRFHQRSLSLNSGAMRGTKVSSFSSCEKLDYARPP